MTKFIDPLKLDCGKGTRDGQPITWGEMQNLNTPEDWAKFMGITVEQWLNREKRRKMQVAMCFPEGEA